MHLMHIQDLSLAIPTADQLRRLNEHKLMRSASAVDIDEAFSDAKASLSRSSSDSQLSAKDDTGGGVYGWLAWIVSYVSATWHAVMPAMGVQRARAHTHDRAVTDAVHLHDCLRSFFMPDQLRGDNMYNCERCGK
jgi:hypothetical protein